jgi:hypothetical protein
MRQPAVRCVEFVESVTDWMEGALEDPARLVLEEHLVICPHCTEYLLQLRLAEQVLADAPPPAAPPPAAREALLEAFRRERPPTDG